ncbi:MAG: HesA/MoeB/ThiF family protein [Parvularculaceae bacterium]|nr:HesA/MoeB/ThiF family protein [Parvularculaceae bacterium]
MLDPDARERYLRHILLKEIGAQGQQRLLAARVLIVGAGGIGSPVIQYLTGAGVGRIGIADDDVVSLSNLQRQTIYRDEDIGAAKAECAATYARALNPGVTVTAIPERLDFESARSLLLDFDLVVEGVDTIRDRHALNEASVATQTPMVSAALGRFEAQISLFKPWAGPDLPCYRCLVPETTPRDAVLTCAEEGVAGPIAGIAGAVAALEAIKALTGAGETLAGRLFIFDGLGLKARTVHLPRDPNCSVCSTIPRSSL